MSQLGTIVTIDVDPTANDGLDQAAAIVTGVYDDGSLRLRVLGATSYQDTVLNSVDATGAPWYDANGVHVDPAPATSSTDSTSTSSTAPVASSSSDATTSTDSSATVDANTTQPITQQPGQEPAQTTASGQPGTEPTSS